MPDLGMDIISKINRRGPVGQVYNITLWGKNMHSFLKNFSLGEARNLQFRAEFFNLFNTPQFDLPNGSIGNPAAGRITNVVGNPRQVQLGLRLVF